MGNYLVCENIYLTVEGGVYSYLRGFLLCVYGRFPSAKATRKENEKREKLKGTKAGESREKTTRV